MNLNQNTEQSPIVAGQELKYIKEWKEDFYDELDELKKIFFEFLKRWTDSNRFQLDPNKPVYYEAQEGVEEFQLDQDSDYLRKITEIEEDYSSDKSSHSHHDYQGLSIVPIEYAA